MDQAKATICVCSEYKINMRTKGGDCGGKGEIWSVKKNCVGKEQQFVNRLGSKPQVLMWILRLIYKISSCGESNTWEESCEMCLLVYKPIRTKANNCLPTQIFIAYIYEDKV